MNQPKKNGKWWAGVGGVLGIVVAAIAILVYFGVPRPGDIVTKAEAAEKHEVLEARIVDVEEDAQQEVKALRDQNASEHKAFNQSVQRIEKKQDEQSKTLWMIYREVKK